MPGDPYSTPKPPGLLSLMETHIQQLNGQVNSALSHTIAKHKQLALQSLHSPMPTGTHAQDCPRCDCTGSVECSRKIAFLEGKIREYLNVPYKRKIAEIYDIERDGTPGQNYLVEFEDATLQKVSVGYLKSNYLRDYVHFLQQKCFD